MAEPIVSEDPANPLDQLSPLESPRAVLQWLQHQQGHQRFLEGHSLHPHSTRERMRAVVEGQHPLAAVLGCADSRVVPIQRAGRPPRQSTPDRLTLSGQRIGGGVS